jgi:hypothetical protein
MTAIPNYFLDELIYKNYENRSRETFRLDAQPCRLTALYAELLHVTIAQRRLWSANLACSFEPFSWVCDEDNLLIAVTILVSQGKLVVDKPVEKYERRKTESAVGGYYYPLETIKVLWVEPVANDAFWLAWDKGLSILKRWMAGHDRMKALAQLALWEDKLTEAKNAIVAWKRRLKSDEDAIAQATIHPHLVDACDPRPESDS